MSEDLFLRAEAWADANPELVAKFLRVYLRAVNMIQEHMKKQDLKALVPEYKRFFLEWAGKNYSDAMALKDLETHPVFNLKEQLELLDASKGVSTAQKWHIDIATFFTEVGRLTKDDLKKVQDGKYVTDKFLKLIKAPQLRPVSQLVLLPSSVANLRLGKSATI